MQNRNIYLDSLFSFSETKPGKTAFLEAETGFGLTSSELASAVLRAAGAIMSATGGSLYSRFSRVRKIHAYPGKNLIVLKGRLIRPNRHSGILLRYRMKPGSLSVISIIRRQ